ncbi:hypothetical protein RKD18_000392 [Streptomyces phaeoluteigriseus]
MIDDAAAIAAATGHARHKYVTLVLAHMAGLRRHRRRHHRGRAGECRATGKVSLLGAMGGVEFPCATSVLPGPIGQ